MDRLANEEKALNDSGAGNPINNLSKPSQTGDIEASMLVMSSISVGPSWWQMSIGGGRISLVEKSILRQDVGLWSPQGSP